MYLKQIDKLGRLVIPSHVRKQLEIEKGNLLKISVLKNTITIKKYNILVNYETVLKNCIISKYGTEYSE